MKIITKSMEILYYIGSEGTYNNNINAASNRYSNEKVFLLCAAPETGHFPPDYYYIFQFSSNSLHLQPPFCPLFAPPLHPVRVCYKNGYSVVKRVYSVRNVRDGNEGHSIITQHPIYKY